MSAFALAASLLVLGGPVSAQGESVPEAAVVDGMPQGLFLGRSLLTGRAVCLLFLNGGRVTRAIPAGGLEHFDWTMHLAAHRGDVGEWTLRGGRLRIEWGDGGVHEGPLSVRPDGIEFFGKRYIKPVTVELASIVGRWEAIRGTAIVGGAGVNEVNSLEISADGRYRWTSVSGGSVSGRAVASEETASGTVTIKGTTIVLHSDAGTTTEYTFLPAGRNPVTAFSLDTDLFTRS